MSAFCLITLVLHKKGMWGPLETRECFDLASRLVSNKGCESNPEGLSKNRHLICELLRKYQFEIEEITNPKAPYRPVIIAKRIVQGNERTVGFFGHYDVEEAMDWEPVEPKGMGLQPVETTGNRRKMVWQRCC